MAKARASKQRGILPQKEEPGLQVTMGKQNTIDAASCGHRKQDLWGKEPHPNPYHPLKQAAGVVVPWGRAGVMKVRRQESSLQSKECFAGEGERGGTSNGSSDSIAGCKGNANTL